MTRSISGLCLNPAFTGLLLLHAELESPGGGTEYKNSSTLEIREKVSNSPSPVGTRKYEKKKQIYNGHCLAVFANVPVFFGFFSGPSPGWGSLHMLSYIFRISRLEEFLYSVPPPRDHKHRAALLTAPL